MTIAKGVNKKIGFKKESTWGTLAGASGAQILRRVTANFNLKKETYESNEIRTDYQVADMRHGIRSAEGSLSGELSPKTYSSFMASVVARDFTTAGSATGLSVTIATSGSLFTVTRSAGSWLTDGFYVGNIVRLTGAGLNLANQSNNMLVVSMTAIVLTVRVLSNTALVAEGPIATVTATAVGKQTYAPSTGHTDDSYTIEEWYSDIAQSEVYTGIKIGSMAVKMPATGLVTVDFNMQGKNLDTTGTSQYFSSPTAAGTEGIFAAVNGAVVVNGIPVAVITSADFTVDRGIEAANVLGSNYSADMFTGRIRLTGNISTYFQDGTFRDYFNNESVISLVFALVTGTGKTADAVAFSIPKVKIGSNTRDDKENGITSTHTFTALLNDVTTGGLAPTTILIQDTLA